MAEIKKKGTIVVEFHGTMHIPVETTLDKDAYQRKFLTAFLKRPEDAIKKMGPDDILHATAEFIASTPV